MKTFAIISGIGGAILAAVWIAAVIYMGSQGAINLTTNLVNY